MFCIDQNPSYTAPVAVKMPGDKGKFTTVKFNARFKRVSLTEFEALNAAIREKTMTDAQLIDEVLVGWGDVENKNGEPVEFTPENLEVLLDIFPVRPSIVQAFFDSIHLGAAKN